ncbi:MAG: glycosyltransferase family 2 protein [Bacteroidales bacterium]|nr:glycosyltransferase family 2 protein [Bacteroidales bacterium]MCF6342539.1 glycosyltransferase family 2 protein [Bacteroidales bacterium]
MLQNKLPLVSTIITVNNGGLYIAEALQSILIQDFKNIEIIVIDDGSTDNTASVVQHCAPDVHYYHQEKAGISAGKNLGVKKAKGTFFAFLDADDIWTEKKISTQLGRFNKNPSLDMVFGHVGHFFSPELSAEERKKHYCPGKAMPGISSGTMLIRSGSFYKVGLFDPHYRKGVFNDWYLRASELGLTFKMQKEVFLKRRIHQKNHGITNRDKSVDYVRMLKASLDRRRKKEYQ